MQRIAGLALAVACFASPAVAGGPQVGWKGASYSLAKLPPELPADARSAIDVWTPWATAHGYRFDLDASARALIVSPSSGSAATKQVALLERVVKFTDDRLPAPGPTTNAPAKPPASGAIPEDPEAPPAGEGKSLEESLQPQTTAWGAGSQALDRGTVVLLVVKNEEHYGSVVDELVRLAPYLAGWSNTAKSLQGFTLEEPLAGAFLLSAAGQEEWDPENELVHRAAELLLLRRFGRQPYWIQQGWAWHVEIELCDDVYCFPYRSEFVWATEHTSWDKALRELIPASDRDARFTADALRALERGAWDAKAAKFAWATALYLDRYKQGALPKILGELRAAWDAGSRRELGGGQWERDVHFEVDTAATTEILTRHAGADLFESLLHFFRSGATEAHSKSSPKSARYRRG